MKHKGNNIVTAKYLSQYLDLHLFLNFGFIEREKTIIILTSYFISIAFHIQLIILSLHKSEKT